MNKKTIGRRKNIEDSILTRSQVISEAATLLNTVGRLRCTKRVCKKGIYKFKTFEEADQWMEDMIVRNSLESLR